MNSNEPINPIHSVDGKPLLHQGLAVRDYVAIEMAKVIFPHLVKEKGEGIAFRTFAEITYYTADALIAESNKHETKN